MSVQTLALLALFSGAIIQFSFHRLPLSVAVPTLVLSAWVAFTEFRQPYSGGGASMWPVALFFVAVFSAVSALAGAMLVTATTRK